MPVFKIPTLNFAASNYIDIVNWQDTIVTEPPLTQAFFDQEIDTFIRQRHLMQVEKLPCYTQAVERCVKLVTE